MRSDLGQFLGHNSPLVAQTKLKRRRNVTGKQSSRLVCLVFAYAVYFLSYAWPTGRRRKKERKKERKTMNKIDTFKFGFFQLDKGQRNY